MPYKTHKIALAPTFRERRWFASQCGYARFAYNHALSDFKAGLENDYFQSWQTLNDNFNKTKKRYDWTRSQDQRA
ncbi:transposase, partial [Candidatus Poribacteria bacterium]